MGAKTLNKKLMDKSEPLKGRPPVNINLLTSYIKEYTENWQTLFPDDPLPTLEQFSQWKGVSLSTIERKRKSNATFRRAYRALMALQRQIIIKNGMTGKFNSMFAKFVLSANHGMREKSDITSNNKAISLSVKASSKSTDEMV